MILILHADHEQNCSTSTVRMVGSSRGQPVRVSLGRHLRPVGAAARRGEPGRASRCSSRSTDGGRRAKDYVELAKDKDIGFRLMGFGHRVYKNYDPRAQDHQDSPATKSAGQARTATIRCSTSPEAWKRWP